MSLGSRPVEVSPGVMAQRGRSAPRAAGNAAGHPGSANLQPLPPLRRHGPETVGEDAPAAPGLNQPAPQVLGPCLCPVCGLEVDSQQLLTRHLRDLHKGDVLSGRQANTTTASSSSDCPLCTTACASRKDLERHIAETHGTSGPTSFSHSRNHSASSRPVGPQSLMSPTGGTTASNPAPLRRQSDPAATAGPPPPPALSAEGMIFWCDKCGQVFSDVLAKNRHEASCGLEPFRCKTCGMGFSRLSSLTNHQASKHRGRRYTCPTCGKSYPWRASLFNHRKTCRPQGGAEQQQQQQQQLQQQ